MEKFSKNFVTHYENIKDIGKEKDPQEQSGAFKSLYRSHTAEKLAQEIIQGVVIHLVKKQPNGKLPAKPEGGRKINGRRTHIANQP